MRILRQWQARFEAWAFWLRLGRLKRRGVKAVRALVPGRTVLVGVVVPDQYVEGLGPEVANLYGRLFDAADEAHGKGRTLARAWVDRQPEGRGYWLTLGLPRA